MNLEEPLTVRLEMDEMWGRVYCKETPCWLWHAINHENGELIAYVLGSREHDMLQQLLELLNGLNLNIVSVYSDNNFAYHDIISQETLQTGKKNTQKNRSQTSYFSNSFKAFWLAKLSAFQNLFTCIKL